MLKNKKLLPRIIIIAVATIAVIIAAIFIVRATVKSNQFNKALQTANDYLTSLDYESAIASYKSAIEINPNNVEAYLGLADAYIGLEDYDSAISVLNDGLAVLPDNAVLSNKISQAQTLSDAKIAEEQKLAEYEEELAKETQEATAQTNNETIQAEETTPEEDIVVPQEIDFSPADFKFFGISVVDDECTGEYIWELNETYNLHGNECSDGDSLDCPNGILLYDNGDAYTGEGVAYIGYTAYIFYEYFFTEANIAKFSFIEIPQSLNISFVDMLNRIGISDEESIKQILAGNHFDATITSQYGDIEISCQYANDYSVSDLWNSNYIDILYPDNSYIKFLYNNDDISGNDTLNGLQVYDEKP